MDVDGNDLDLMMESPDEVNDEEDDDVRSLGSQSRSPSPSGDDDSAPGSESPPESPPQSKSPTQSPPQSPIADPGTPSPVPVLVMEPLPVPPPEMEVEEVAQEECMPPMDVPEVKDESSNEETQAEEIIEESPSTPNSPPRTSTPPSTGTGTGTGTGRGVKRESEDEPVQPPSKKRSDEVEKLWRNVHHNPNDFQAWTLLLQHIDQVSDLHSGREAYDGFFDRYPYCYGYWKKYADLERRKGNRETTLKVFERGLHAIGLSVDLWLHYIDYITSQFPDNEPFIRQQYEKAIATCGLEFKSDKLWEAYLGWESGGKRWKNVTQVFERLLATPTSKYLTHWQKFQDHVRRHLPSEVVGVDEFLSLRREVLSSLSRSDTDAPDEAPPGVEAAPGDDQIGTNVQDEETKALQKSIISARQKLHEDNVASVKAMWNYEDAIKRPYFHVKPLEKSQIQAWRNYIDFEMKAGCDARITVLFERCLIACAFYEEFWMRYFHVKPLEKSQIQAWRNYIDFEMKAGCDARITVLFERCLIACAFYEEFWMRYIRYLESSNAEEDVIRGVYERACTIHLRDKYRPHMTWAAFEEEKGKSDKALEILKGVQERVVGGLEAWVQAAGVERRRGRLDEAAKIFTKCIECAKDRVDKAAHSHISMKYARFLSMFCDANEEPLNILKAAYEYDKDNSSLVVALVDQALSCRPARIKDATDILKAAVEDTSYEPGTRLVFAHRLFHFLSECAQEPTSMSEGLKILRSIQMEVRQMDANICMDNDGNTHDNGGHSNINKHNDNNMSGGIAVIESRRDKRSQEKGSPGPVNGNPGLSSNPPNSANTPPSQQGGGGQSGGGQGGGMVGGYGGGQGGYGQGGYGNYNYNGHQYNAAAAAAAGYQGWPYPTQQQYPYPQQAWPTYNYYGQR